jgi:hypothetical protein
MNVPVYFMYLMNKAFMEYLDKFVVVLVFINDILVYSKTEEEYEEHLRLVFEKLTTNQLYAKFNKCEFWITQVAFLGHVISVGEHLRLVFEKLTTNQLYAKFNKCEFWITQVAFLGHDKVKDVLSWMPPTNVSEIHSFLGLAGYYRRFIQDFSKIAKPMTRLLEKGKAFEWTQDCQASFGKLKKRLTTTLILTLSDISKKFDIY